MKYRVALSTSDVPEVIVTKIESLKPLDLGDLDQFKVLVAEQLGCNLSPDLYVEYVEEVVPDSRGM